MHDADELSPEDRAAIDALEDPDDIEAFKNIADNARLQGKTGVQLVREDYEHTSRKAIRRLCSGRADADTAEGVAKQGVLSRAMSLLLRISRSGS